MPKQTSAKIDQSDTINTSLNTNVSTNTTRTLPTIPSAATQVSRYISIMAQVGGIKAVTPEDTDPENAILREVTDDATFSGLAFKIAVDPYLGSLTFLRLYRYDRKVGFVFHLAVLAQIAFCQRSSCVESDGLVMH